MSNVTFHNKSSQIIYNSHIETVTDKMPAKMYSMPNRTSVFKWHDAMASNFKAT